MQLNAFLLLSRRVPSPRICFLLFSISPAQIDRTAIMHRCFQQWCNLLIRDGWKVTVTRYSFRVTQCFEEKWAFDRQITFFARSFTRLNFSRDSSWRRVALSFLSSYIHIEVVVVSRAVELWGEGRAEMGDTRLFAKLILFRIFACAARVIVNK